MFQFSFNVIEYNEEFRNEEVKQKALLWCIQKGKDKQKDWMEFQ